MIAKPKMWWPGIRRGHPLARGLIGLWPMWEAGGGRLGNAANPSLAPGTITGSVWTPSGGPAHGPVVQHDAVGDYVDFGPSSNYLPTSAISVAVIYRKTDGTDRVSTLFGVHPGAGASKCGAFPWNNGTVYWDFGGDTEGVTRVSEPWGPDTDWHYWVFSCGSRGMEINLDNAILDSNAANPTRTSTTDPFRLGKTQIGAADLSETAFLAVASRQWNLAEIAEWNDGPFGLITPRKRSYFFYQVPAAGNPWWYYQHASMGAA